MRRSPSLLAILAAAAIATIADAQSPRPVTVDDLMRVRTIVDAKIAPSGDLVAYVVSTPSVEKNVHETALFVVAASGGVPQRLADDRQIFTPALPAPRLRWTPDGSVSFLALAGNRPQRFAEINVAAVEIGQIEQPDAAVVGVTEEVVELAEAQPSLVRLPAPAVNAGSLREPRDAEPGVPERHDRWRRHGITE